MLTESLRTPASLIEEKKNMAVMMTKAEIVCGIAGVIDVNDCSTLKRHVKVTAWIKRFIDNSRAKAKKAKREANRKIGSGRIEMRRDPSFSLSRNKHGTKK